MKSVDNREYHTDNVTLPNTPGKGLKLGTYETTAKFGWRDILGQVINKGVGSNDPPWSQIGTSVFYAYKFAVNDEVWIPYHIPHDLVPNTAIYFHAHWLPDGTNVQPVKWEFSYIYARGFDQDNFSIPGTTVTAQEAPPGTAYRHMVTETAAVTIANLDEPDGIIYTRCRRITNGGTDNANGIFLLTADVHYQSTNLATKQKAPNFYAD